MRHGAIPCSSSVESRTLEFSNQFSSNLRGSKKGIPPWCVFQIYFYRCLYEFRACSPCASMLPHDSSATALLGWFPVAFPIALHGASPHLPAFFCLPQSLDLSFSALSNMFPVNAQISNVSVRGWVGDGEQ